MSRIAIAVRETELFLQATVVRAPQTDVYVNWPRDATPDWKPHTSYHASGQHHHKSFGTRVAIRTGERPDVAFAGTRNVVSFGIAAGEHSADHILCNPQEFDATFEVPINLVSATRYATYAYVDLVAPGVDPILYPGATIKMQEIYKDAEPWIIITFLEIPLGQVKQA